jgi:hypothetical protein
MTIELLTVEMFSDKVGETFVIEDSNVPAVELTLTEAVAMRNYANSARAPFSLTFTSRGSSVLPQRMYALRHAVLGSHSIFLVPIAGSKEAVTYQAIFN